MLRRNLGCAGLLCAVGLVACSPSKEEREAHKARLAEMEAANAANEEAAKQEEAAGKKAKGIAVSALRPLGSAWANTRTKLDGLPECTAALAEGSPPEVLSLRALLLSGLDRDPEQIEYRSSPYDSGAFSRALGKRLGGPPNAGRPKAAKFIAETSHFVVVDELEIVEPKADEASKTFVPGTVEAVGVLFANHEARCTLGVSEQLAERTEVVAREVEGVATGDLTSALRRKARARLAGNFAEATGGKITGLAE